MGYFSDRDIRKALNKDIVIEPFAEELLTPIGYDFTVGDYVFSLQDGLIDVKDGSYEIPQKHTVQILTKESLWVSGRIGGTFHSKVSLVSRGLSHISTTLDPGWYGPLLITVRNNTDEPFHLKPGESFVTLVFSRLVTPTTSPHNKPPFRIDILFSGQLKKQVYEQIKDQTEKYIDKITGFLGDDAISATFRSAVLKTNSGMLTKIIKSIRIQGREVVLWFIVRSFLNIVIISLTLLSVYWSQINIYFNNIPYDSKVFAAQLVAIISVLSLRINISKKRD